MVWPRDCRLLRKIRDIRFSAAGGTELGSHLAGVLGIEPGSAAELRMLLAAGAERWSAVRRPHRGPGLADNQMSLPPVPMDPAPSLASG